MAGCPYQLSLIDAGIEVRDRERSFFSLHGNNSHVTIRRALEGEADLVDVDHADLGKDFSLLEVGPLAEGGLDFHEGGFRLSRAILVAVQAGKYLEGSRASGVG